VLHALVLDGDVGACMLEEGANFFGAIGCHGAKIYVSASTFGNPAFFLPT
jgi:hypothetical protein